MKIEETYVITESDIRYKYKDVVATIKITQGDFKDTVFHFGEIPIPELKKELKKNNIEVRL